MREANAFLQPSDDTPDSPELNLMREDGLVTPDP